MIYGNEEWKNEYVDLLKTYIDTSLEYSMLAIKGIDYLKQNSDLLSKNQQDRGKYNGIVRHHSHYLFGTAKYAEIQRFLDPLKKIWKCP